MIKNLACGAAGLVLAALYYTLADSLPRSLLDDPTGASGLPKVLGVLLGGLSAALIVVTLVRRIANDAGRGWKAHLRAAGMLALGILYLLALPWLGYLGAIFLLLLAVSLYSGVRFGVAPATISVVGALMLWGVFVRLFGIAMPSGVWFG